MDEKWWPSKFGPDDQAGATSWITPQSRDMNLSARRGIYMFENLDLSQLSANRAYEFLFAWALLKLMGATGSPGNPIAAY